MNLHHFYLLFALTLGPSIVEIAAIFFGIYMAVWFIAVIVQAFSSD